MLDADKDRQQIIQKVIQYATKQLPAKELTRLKPFIEHCYSHAPLEDLAQRSPQDLFGAVSSLFNLGYKRKAGEYKRRIFNPTLQADGWESTHTVLEVVLDDQPFLVDTLCTEINREGFAVHFLMHLGGIKVERNAKHEVTHILAPNETAPSEALVEAPIYIEIDRQTDPKVLKELGENIDRVIKDARLAVNDWKKLQNEVYAALEEIEQVKPPATAEDIDEAKAFLRWLLDNHFTFLGYRRYDFVMDGKKAGLQLVKNTGLGVLRDTSQSKLIRYYADLTPEAKKLGLSNQILLLAKTNTRSTVHGHRYTDFVSVKRFDEAGKIIGERWFVGLYTSGVYNDSPRTFPLVRLKIAEVLKRSELPPKGHAYKALAHILETLPRDDLFQANPEELFTLGTGILQMQDRRGIRLFARREIYGRFVSCLVYVPRDDFNMELCYRMQDILQAAFFGLEISYETRFFDSILARIHFTIRIDPKKRRSYDLTDIERQLIEAGRSWKDGLHEQLVKYFGEEQGNALNMRYSRAFPVSYQETFSPQNAVLDVERIEQITAKYNLEMSLYASRKDDLIRFKLFHPDETIPLSDAIPILEQMGLRVIGEQPYRLQFKNGSSVWINDFGMRYSGGELDIETDKENFQEAFRKIWSGEAEDDGFNALVLSAHLNWREVAILRAFAKYLKQIGFTFSQDYMETTLARNPEVVKGLVQMFYEKFDPALQSKKTEQSQLQLADKVAQALEGVANLDEDRILRMFLNLIHASVRTNYFQKDSQGENKPYLSFKLNPDLVHDLPLPKPEHEIFVYSPRFEGIHLRAGKVARGGIRWSDRREDFRREVLGLMKAQQVKNAIIVPAGSKGGFIPKLLPIDADREQIMQEGIHCYQGFIRGLLDITDNLQANTVLRPADTVCYDDEDPYLVVAADKGTATFSDIANAISLEYGFWLGDAFASGGSAGYDHKKMGITARGAWESVKRHFQELEVDINNNPFTVVGIGDMAGDVFGNGMLQSKQIKLLGAFNGTHIFIDPNPDPAVSFVERQRLFNLPRSTWEDYNPALISPGGGVFKRSVKTIKLTAEAKKTFGIKKDQIAPNDLVQVLLKANVDLLWNGGIGTYVKASDETHLDAADRTNDGVRVNGNELTCRVVGEGGNLGCTQLGRIEYELSGGRINTDFIDNSGGVDCSDHEVNIKILLNGIVAQGELTEKSRNTLLAKMTDEVAHLVLYDNYRQVRALSANTDLSSRYLDLFSRYIKECVKQGRLDRELEYLPSDETLMTRKANGKGFTRPEIAVLLAYSKNILKAEIVQADLLKDAYFERFIQYAFPQILRKRYPQAMNQHRLRQEIIATQLINTLINDMGITFVYQMYDETRAETVDIINAYVITKEIFALEDLWKTIEALDVTIGLQIELILELVQLMRRSVRWFLRNLHSKLDAKSTIHRFSAGVEVLAKGLNGLLIGMEKTLFEQKSTDWVNAGVPGPVAIRIAGLRGLNSALNIIEAASERHADLQNAAIIYFTLADRLGLDEFREMINRYPVDSRWTVLARSAVKGDLDWQQRTLTQMVLKQKNKNAEPQKLVEIWLEENKTRVERWLSVLMEMKANPTQEYSMLVVAVRELMELLQVN